MMVERKEKTGFTLVELMVVIVIMGILSAMGFAGLQGAVKNHRLEDAAVNTTAFLMRVAAKADQMSAPLCITGSGNTLKAYSKCEVKDGKLVVAEANLVDSYTLESPLKFTSTCPALPTSYCNRDNGCVDWLGVGNGVFAPKLGLSAAPAAGYVCVQYGSSSDYGATLKEKQRNQMGTWIYANGWSSL